jgi:hypothetical protein
VKRLSSIFSFETLRIGRFTCRAMGLALLLVLLAEGACRVGVKRGWLQRDPQLKEHIDNLTAAVAGAPRAFWFLGNSTLGAGLDRGALPPDMLGKTHLLIHGSASLRSGNAMLEYYLQRASAPPDTLVVFNLPSHMNRNGKGPGRTTEGAYQEILRTGRVSDSPPLMLLQIRTQLRNALERRFLGTFSKAVAGNPAGGMVANDAAYYSQVFADYESDLGAMSELAEIGRRYGIRRTLFVVMPVTRGLKEWFDLRPGGIPYDAVVGEIVRSGRVSGLECWDASGVCDDAADFKDPYHLNRSGSAQLTREFLKILDSEPERW